MNLIRQFPVPSDRMGILWSTLPLRDGAVIEYGPAGTTHYGAELIGDLGIPLHENLFCTHVDENDVVMGDLTRLEQAILEVDGKYAPKCICVVGSSLTSVIGADLTGLCRMLRSKVKSTLIPFEHGGFRGDYTLGVKDGLTALLRAFAQPRDGGEPGTYTIVGACFDSYRMASDLQEVERLMEEAFGMTCRCAVPMASDSETIAHCSRGDCVLCLRREGEEGAAYLQELGAGQVISQAPYGYAGTLAWLRQVSQATGRTCQPALLSRLEEKAAKAAMLGKQLRVSGLAPRALVEGPAGVVEGLGGFLKDELGYEVTGLVSHSTKEFPHLPPWMGAWEEKEKLVLYSSCRDALVLGSDCTLQNTDHTNEKLKIAIPTLHGITRATHLPFQGERGADFLLESVLTHQNALTLKHFMR